MYTSTVPINNFIHEISEIDEYDFGDFMRRANHYLLILMDKTYRSSNPQIKKLLNELHYTIQYQPDWDIESTRQKIFAGAELIRKSLRAQATKNYYNINPNRSPNH